ncbi:MAG: DUF4406 domain-containing protein [Kiritimatiellae bacterium]|nr:DUF4406 domain-containing protein [Kiritimatiellia bacterium]
MSKKRIYIAGPMRGCKKYNYPAFISAANLFRQHPKLRENWEVVSPVEIGKSFGTPDTVAKSPAILARLMEFELAAVKSCDAIHLLSGWETSEGARAALRVALDNKLYIYQDNEEFRLWLD